MEADGRPLKKPTSPWVYVGCGCAAIVVLAMVVLGALSYLGYRKGKEFTEGMTDPVKREARVKAVLPYQQLPPGYYPAFAMSMPLGFMEMAMLTDRDPGPGKSGPDQGFEERGFMFMSMRQMKDNKAKMERFLRGEAASPDSQWYQSNVKFNPKEVIRRGTVTVNGTEVLYSASRGEIQRHQTVDKHGVVTMVMPQCSHDTRLRFGMWFGPDPAPDKPIAEADYSGSNADPAAMQEFLGHFQLCPK